MTIGPFWPPRWIASLPDVGEVADDVLPYLPGQTLLSKKEPEWSTGVQKSASGRRRTAAYYSAPEWTFQLSYNAVRKRPGLDEWSRIVSFFNRRKGRAGEFRFFDRTDHLVSNEWFGTGDGTTTVFQLMRSINGWQEPVHAVLNIEWLTVNGLPAVYTLGELGRVVMLEAPAAGAVLRWSGAFYFLCAFDMDALPGSQPFGRIWEMKNISFTSIKP